MAGGIVFLRNGGGGAGASFGFLERFGIRFESIHRESFLEPIIFPRQTRRIIQAVAPPASVVEELAPTAVPPTVPIVPSFEGVEPVGFFDDLFDVFQDAAVNVGRTAARLLVPDPIEASIQILFPDVGAQVFGSPLGLPAPQIVPPSFPAVISEAGAIPGATPPFLPGPPGTIGRLEDLFPGTFPTGLPGPFLPAPADINDPGFGVVQDQPGIFDDIGRAVLDIVPELIPEIFGGGVGGAIAEGLFTTGQEVFGPGGQFASDPVGETFIPLATEGVTNVACVTLPAVVDYQTWVSAGRPAGFTANPCDGLLHRKRRRRRRPLSQQAKDDLAWAKATFGAGKQFDAVVSRMRF